MPRRKRPRARCPCHGRYPGLSLRGDTYTTKRAFAPATKSVTQRRETAKEINDSYLATLREPLIFSLRPGRGFRLTSKILPSTGRGEGEAPPALPLVVRRRPFSSYILNSSSFCLLPFPARRAAAAAFKKFFLHWCSESGILPSTDDARQKGKVERSGPGHSGHADPAHARPRPGPRLCDC